MAVKSEYSLVCFQDEDNIVYTVPGEWIYTAIHGNTSCRWSQHVTGKTIEKAMKEIESG